MVKIFNKKNPSNNNGTSLEVFEGQIQMWNYLGKLVFILNRADHS